jgi:DNA-binding transcriptional regulator of glucitol operon
MEVSVSVDNPSVIVQEETEILEQNKKTRGNKRGRFNKGKVKELIKKEEVTETSENILPQNPEIELTVEPKPVEEGTEVKEEKDTKDSAAVVEESENSEVTPKKTRRPNRGQGKSKTRRTSKSKKNEDEE